MKTKMPEVSIKVKDAIKLIGKYKYILIVILAGAVLMLLPTSSSGGETSGGEAAEESEEDFSVEKMEQRIAEVLAQVDGAGKVEVILTLKTSTEVILARDEQTSYKSSGEQGEVTDYDMDSDVSTVVISTGSGTEEAVVIKRIYPEYLGALVVCEGGDSASVRLKIVQAISSLTGLKADKITVIKMKN